MILSVLNSVVGFAATSEFTFSGCMAVDDKPLKNSIPPALLCAYGGGIVRDTWLWCFVTHKAVPVAFSAYESWVASVIGFFYFALLKWRKELYIAHRGWQKWLLSIVDYAGAANFLVAGILRAMEFGIKNPAALTLAGSITALGGGLITLATIRKNKGRTFMSNIPYYFTVFGSAAVVANIPALHTVIVPVTTLATLFCSMVGASVLYICTEEYTPLRFKKTSLGKKIGLITSPAALFRANINPKKGVRQITQFSMTAGARIEYQIIPVTI